MRYHILWVNALVQSVHVKTQNNSIVQMRFGHILGVVTGGVNGRQVQDDAHGGADAQTSHGFQCHAMA